MTWRPARLPVAFDQRSCEKRDHDLVMPRNRVSASDTRGRPGDDVRERSVVAEKIEIDCGEPLERAALVSYQCDRLEKHFGENDGRSAIEVHAALEPRDHRRKIAKVAQACVAERRTRCQRMHMHDIGADRDMYSQR